MELRALRYFAHVAEALSFSTAAQRLDLSQSAVSRQVQLLERELGVRLFDRVGRKVQLTAAGLDLLERSYAVQKSVSELASRASELASGTRGALRIGATPQTLESLISVALPGFQERHPDARIGLIEGGSANLARALERGDIDLAVGSFDRDHDFQSRALFPLVVLAALPRRHRLHDRKRIDIADLADDPVLLLRKDFMTRTLFDEACVIARISPRIVIESGNPHCLLALVQAGLGIAIVPSTFRFAKHHPKAVALVRGGRPLGCPLTILWDPRRYLGPLARSFIDELASFVKAGRGARSRRAP